MLVTALKRILRSGFVSFYRNSVVSVAAILVVTITLFVIGSLLMTRAVLGYSLNQLKDKVDVNVYFNLNAPEDKIMALKGSLEALPEVASVEYVSKDVALERFKKRHESDYLTLQAIEELGENPLGDALNIKAKETSQYESIAKFLGGDSAIAKDNKTIIDRVNYYQNKSVIDKLNNIIISGKKLGVAVTLVLIVISLIITFNTIRLIIFISRDEISVMRLVGASNIYIRGPFMVGGILYGLISSIITMAIFYPVTLWLGNNATNFLGGLNLFHYYTENFFQIFLIMVMAGSILGAISAYLAVRKYLNT